MCYGPYKRSTLTLNFDLKSKKFMTAHRAYAPPGNGISDFPVENIQRIDE